CSYPGCTEAFVSSGELKIHIRRNHTDEKPYQCPHCMHATTTSYQLNEHIIRKHTDERPHKCPHCNYKGKVKRDLNRHIREMHNQERPHKCPHCNYKGKRKRDLNEHITRHHTNERPYNCPHCDYSGKVNRDVNEHIIRHHTNERPYECPHCDYAGKTWSDCKGHIKCIHNDERPYICPYSDCYESYKESSKLLNHIRRFHTGEKPHKCPYLGCTEAFVSSSELKIHIRRNHTGEKPYKCPDCDYVATTSYEIKEHQRKNGCFYSLWDAIKWERLCLEIAEFLLRGRDWDWQRPIDTPEIEERRYIRPEIVIRHPGGIIEFIDAKRTIFSIVEKDITIYPEVDKVTFWVLFGGFDLDKSNTDFSIVSSNQLIKKLEAQKTSKNRDEIDDLILRIVFLQRGLDKTKQSVLTSYFIEEKSFDFSQVP
ncbi:MAG: C2H2-type zinc finger protein, partial [Promethearchaeota archaeon]